MIEHDRGDAALSATSASMVQAPRADPAHPKPSPINLPIDGQNRLAGSLIMKILVRSDGTVADAAVVRTLRRPGADAAAINFIKAQWKFLPALLDGRPIEYWTRVDRNPQSLRKYPFAVVPNPNSKGLT